MVESVVGDMLGNATAGVTIVLVLTAEVELEAEQLGAGQLGAGPVSLLGAVAGLVSSHTDRQASLPAVNR